MEWTDKRLDDFTKRVGKDFEEIKGDIKALDKKLHVLDTKIDGKIDGLRLGIEADLRHLDGKLNALIVAMIVGVLTLIGVGITAIVGI